MSCAFFSHLRKSRFGTSDTPLKKTDASLNFPPEDIELFFLEICAAPKHQPDTGFLFAVANDGVLVQKPNGMTMPDLGRSVEQRLVYFLGKQFTKRAVFGSLI